MIPLNRESVKSDEEWSFILWLQEATKHGLVESWEYEPRSFVLFEKQTYIETVEMKTKVKEVERVLHQPESYTPDFEIKLTPLGAGKLYEVFKPSMLSGMADYTVWVDVKGAYNPNDQPRYFSSTRKAMYYVHGIWVTKIIPFASAKKGLFVETFAPESFRWMKNGKQLNRIGRSCRSCVEFLND